MTSETIDEIIPEIEEAPTKKNKKEKKVDAPLTPDGMVIYTDAGARPNPGFAGWGLHGYIYCDQPAKKGSGNSAVYLTNYGYAMKAETKEKPVEVTPLKYLDGIGSIPECTNNVGEVVAMSEGLRHAHEQGVKKVLLLSDSKYAIEGATNHLPNWQSNNWIKRDGTEVKNKQAWMNLAIALDRLKTAGVELKIDKVKAHSTNVGNNMVDNYATLGVMASRSNIHRECIVTSPAEGYWSRDTKHPFINTKYVYFVSKASANHPGEYYLGDHGKDDSLMGKRDADTSYGYVVLKEPEEMLEYARNYVVDVAPTDDCLVNVSVSTIYSQAFGKEVEVHDRFAMARQGHRFNTFTARKEPVISELYPPKIAFRAIDAVNELKGIMLDWKTNASTRLSATDITSRLFTTDAKGVMTLTKEFVPGFTTIKVSASYEQHGEGKGLTDVELTLGVDLPERNALKRIEELKPKVTLVTWRDVSAIRYATIIETADAEGIWAGYYANLVFVK